MKQLIESKGLCSILAMVVLSACGGAELPIPGSERTIATQSQIFRTNDIQLITTLNDSVFSVRGLNATLGRRSKEARHPEVTICIKNVSDSTYLVPFERVGVWACGVTDCAQGVAITLGTSDGHWIGPPMTSLSSLHSMHEDHYFQEIKPGETLCLTEKVGIFQQVFAEKVSAGTYWAAFGYNSFVYQDTTPRVWLGSTLSDTLWFRVVGDSTTDTVR